ncbi:MAG: 50S ribosomal protein L6 [Deltaproteobacteria bacterium]|jgi:large subunit ribosomal protein L6|nr:50S ribosomal protein L6 [Deltaproteobacteria bacterium]MBP6830316.1 50S ribosomal protein L6 [Deltaproteobacteria bacterium]
MSRIGKRPVALPQGVSVTSGADYFEVKGPKGTLRRAMTSDVQIVTKDGQATVEAKADVSPEVGSRMSGTFRSHLNNAVTGVSKGFKRGIRLEGTGYKAELKGSTLTLSLGLSHPVVYEVPKGLSVQIPGDSKNTVLLLETVDRDLLGKAVAQLQSFRPPEPYKGKGVRLMVDGSPTASPVLVKIRQKAGKAGKGGKGGK